MERSVKWTSKNAAKKNKHHNNEGSRRVESSSKRRQIARNQTLLTHTHTPIKVKTLACDMIP